MFFLKELPTQDVLLRYSEKYPNMDVQKTDRALKMLRQASLLIRELESYFSGHDLSQTRFLILIVLDREPELDFLTISDLVTRLDVSKTVVTNTLKSLVENQLVKVTEFPADLRVKTVSITPAGQRKLQEVLPGYYQILNTVPDIHLSD